MNATDQDYTRDLHADLAIAEAATPGPWVRWKGRGEIYAGPAEINTKGEFKSRRRDAFQICVIDEDNRRRARAIAAEEAILEFDAAFSSADGFRYDVATDILEALAARIREGRSHA